MLKIHKDSNKETLNFDEYYAKVIEEDAFLHKLLMTYQDKLASVASTNSIIRVDKDKADVVYVDLGAATDLLNKAVLTIYRMMQKSEEIRNGK